MSPQGSRNTTVFDDFLSPCFSQRDQQENYRHHEPEREGMTVERQEASVEGIMSSAEFATLDLSENTQEVSFRE